jgi:hypothetical protein
MSRDKRFTTEQIIKILREVEIYTAQGQSAELAVRCAVVSHSRPTTASAKNMAASVLIKPNVSKK